LVVRITPDEISSAAVVVAARNDPATAQTYTFHARIAFFTEGLAPRQQR